MIPTMRIKLKDGGTEQIINVEDFNEEIHEKVEVRKKLAKKDDEGSDDTDAKAKKK